MTLLLSLFARWGLPEWIRRPLAWFTAAIALLALLAGLKGCYDRAVVQRYEAKVAAQVARQASQGAAAAAEAVAATRTEVEKANETAREAAADSDDPLKSVADSLRGTKGPPRPAPR